VGKEIILWVERTIFYGEEGNFSFLFILVGLTLANKITKQ